MAPCSPEQSGDRLIRFSINQFPEIFHFVEGYKVAVVGAFRALIPGTGKYALIIAVNDHAGVMSRLSGRTAIGDDSGKTPVEQVFRKMELHPLTFVVRQTVTIDRQQVRAGHTVGGLGA